MSQGVDLKRGRYQKANLQPARVDRLPPHSIEAEQGVLGCVLLSPHDCLAECIEHLGETPEAFYDLRHRVIYEALVEMFDKNQKIDLITLQQRLKDQQKLEGVGGLAYLSSLPDAVPSAANLEYYRAIVREKFVLRKLVATCTEVIGRVYEHEGEVDALLDEFERDALRIRGGMTTTQKSTKELVHEAIAQMEESLNRKAIIDGLSTGFIDLDKLTGGLHPGEMAILGAHSSMGKSSMAMNIAEHVCLELKESVGVFSLEMTSLQLVTRCICSHARVNLRNIKEGFLADRDFPKITGAAGKIAGAKMHFDDTSDLSIFKLRAKARRMHQQHGIKLFIVDYLQLLNAVGGSRKLENRQQEISDISNGLKAMAKELKVPVLVLSQLNDDGKLRESRAPGQDTDHLWILKPSESKEKVAPDTSLVDLWIGKNRNGPRDEVVKLVFMKTYTKFQCAAKVSDSDIPPSSQETINYQTHPDPR